jgi:hypothetical protein
MGSDWPLLLGGVAILWMLTRLAAPHGRGVSGLTSMFRRESLPQRQGLGRRAIATLLADSHALAANAREISGLLLAGPYAVAWASAEDPVTLIFITDRPERYQDREWLAKFGYIARGHDLETHAAEVGAGFALHSLKLRGAPALLIGFVAPSAHSTRPPEGLSRALTAGVTIEHDPRGNIAAIAGRWRGTP